MRLIDAEKCPCKECMSEFHCNNTYCAEFEEWLQKSAYDIDKVVEELLQCTACNGHKDHEKQCGGCAGCLECKLEDAYYKAIEIVKQGKEQEHEM